MNLFDHTLKVTNDTFILLCEFKFDEYDCVYYTSKLS